MPPKPETAASRKLTVVQVRIIRRALETGEVTMEVLARLFGVSYQAIQKIKYEETWRDENALVK